MKGRLARVVASKSCAPPAQRQPTSRAPVGAGGQRGHVRRARAPQLPAQVVHAGPGACSRQRRSEVLPGLGRVVGPDPLHREEQTGGEVLVQDALSAGATGIRQVRRPLRMVPLLSGQVALASGPVGRPHGDQPGDQREDQQDADTDEGATQPSVGSPLSREPRLGRADLALGQDCGGGQERRLGVAEVGVGPLPPLRGAGEPGAAVELAVRAVHRLPGVRGAGQVSEHALPVDVVVEPAAQPRPDPDQRLVGDLDGVPVDAHQPCCDELFHESLVLVVGGHLRPGHPRSHRVAVLGGHHEPQQQGA